jgi:hypothetical protein
MVRELADYQPDRIEAVLRWPLREALISYREKMLASARRAYQHELQMWSAIAPHSSKRIEAPKPPAILREIVH